VIASKLGNSTEKGFVLDEPNIQVFEKKPKKVAAAASRYNDLDISKMTLFYKLAIAIL